MPHIVVAPLSNDPLRDWPLHRFQKVAELCLENLDCSLEFIGTRSQRTAVNSVIRRLPSDRCKNSCGRLAWSETIPLIRKAACVVANNSGIAHLAADLNVPVVSIFCGSHSPLEWMALGPQVTVLTKQTACSPCALGSLAHCPFDRRCFSDIEPQVVFDIIRSKCRQT